LKKIPNKSTDPNSVRLRLVNKKTGKLASSTNWLIDLAAEARELGDSSGISALLPQKKAAKFLVQNELKPFKLHKGAAVQPGDETSHKELRVLVKLAYPKLALFYIQNVVHSHTKKQVNHKGFRAWLMRELSDPERNVSKTLLHLAS
jgi:hypothetical protein